MRAATRTRAARPGRCCSTCSGCGGSATTSGSSSPCDEQPAAGVLRRGRRARSSSRAARRCSSRRPATSVGVPYERAAGDRFDAPPAVNVSGMLADPELLAAIPVRVYLDLDPGVQPALARATGSTWASTATPTSSPSGQAIGRPAAPSRPAGATGSRPCRRSSSTAGRSGRRPAYDALTTVGNWRGYGSIEHDGVLYGQKAHSLRRSSSCPRSVDAAHSRSRSPSTPTSIATSRRSARTAGSSLDPAEVAGTPAAYRGSCRARGPSSAIAKSGYVAVAVRLVQRPQRVLPRLGPAGACARTPGFGDVCRPATGFSPSHDGRRRGRSDRGDARATTRGTRPRPGRSPRSISTPPRAPRLLEQLGLS